MARRRPKELQERVAIVGSRKYPNMDEVMHYVSSLPKDVVVVTGGAEGVDKEAITAAHERFLSVDIYWPDWKKHGRAAGPIRNTQIVENCDRLVAFDVPLSVEDTVAEDLSGQKFERLAVLKQVGRRLNHMFYLCVCDCGEERVVCGSKLKNGHTRSCGCIRFGRPGHERLAAGESMRNRILDNYKRNAARKKVIWELTDEQACALFASHCYYCGTPPALTAASKNHYGTFTYNGIDRMVNAAGYTPKNAVACCTECNFRKGATDAASFLAWVQRITDHQHVADSIAKARAAGKPTLVFTCRRPAQGARRQAREPDLAWWERNDNELVPIAGGRRKPTKVE